MSAGGSFRKGAFGRRWFVSLFIGAINQNAVGFLGGGVVNVFRRLRRRHGGRLHFHHGTTSGCRSAFAQIGRRIFSALVTFFLWLDDRSPSAVVEKIDVRHFRGGAAQDLAEVPDDMQE